MKWKPMKGKCLVCERVRHKGKPVLRYKEFHKNAAILECVVCKSHWMGATGEDVKMQVAG